MSDENARVLAHAEMQGARTKRQSHVPASRGVRGVAECAEERQLSLARQDPLRALEWLCVRTIGAPAPLRETRHALSSLAPTLFPRTPRFRVRSEDV